MAEHPISLEGADGISSGASNADAEGGGPVGDIVAIIGPRITLLGECTLPRNGGTPREA